MTPTLASLLLTLSACDPQADEPFPSEAEIRAHQESEVRWLSTRLDRAADAAEALPPELGNELLDLHDVLVHALEHASPAQLELIAEEVLQLETDVAEATEDEEAWL